MTGWPPVVNGRRVRLEVSKEVQDLAWTTVTAPRQLPAIGRGRHRRDADLGQKESLVKRYAGHPLWWVVPAGVVVVAGVAITVVLVLGPASPSGTATATSSTPVASAPPPSTQIPATVRTDPVTAENSKVYLSKLRGDHVSTVNDTEAVFLGQAVCAERAQFNRSLATLSTEVHTWVPKISKIDANNLVDDSDRWLCPVVGH